MRNHMPSRQAVGSFATGAAWFFIVVSLAHLAWVFWALGDGSGGTAKLYHTVVSGHSYDAWALTYGGSFGIVQASVQALAVLAAAVATTLRSPRLHRPPRRARREAPTWKESSDEKDIWTAVRDAQDRAVADQSRRIVELRSRN